MDYFLLWGQLTMFIGTLYFLYFLFRFVVDLIKESAKPCDDVDVNKTLYGNFQ